jgi:hypothetical protein
MDGDELVDAVEAGGGLLAFLHPVTAIMNRRSPQNGTLNVPILVRLTFDFFI